MNVWIRLDDRAAEHRKLRRLSDAAFRVWVSGLCYCGANLTDGRIPRETAEGLAFTVARRNGGLKWEEIFRELTDPTSEEENPLWHDRGDHLEVHDWLDFNPDRESVERDRESARERMRALRAKRRSGKQSRERSTEHRAEQYGERTTEPTPEGSAARSGEVRQPRTRTRSTSKEASSPVTPSVLRVRAGDDDAARVLAAFESLDRTPDRASREDRRQAEGWLSDGVPVARILAALALGGGRARKPIGSLAYFSRVLGELEDAPPDYLGELASRLESAHA